jgi:hypothetical protein
MIIFQTLGVVSECLHFIPSFHTFQLCLMSNEFTSFEFRLPHESLTFFNEVTIYGGSYTDRSDLEKRSSDGLLPHLMSVWIRLRS